MSDLITDVLTPFDELALDWSTAIGILSTHGAPEAAGALNRARNQLRDTINGVRRDFETLSVDQYGALQRVHPRTVTRWIDAGELAAEQTAKGWRIKRTAIRQKPRA